MKPHTTIIKIASRTSKLAMWQTGQVKAALEKAGHSCQIIPIESTGDVQLQQPIYALGISGVFTKQLDIALLNGEADIAVHSLKDVPTRLAQGLKLAAVLQRGACEDVVLVKDKSILQNRHAEATVASSSLRRRAQWLAKFPKHQIVPIRGNVQTRLQKFADAKDMQGVIFAKAGLERLGLLPKDAITLDWMIPAPAQGIIGIVCREDDKQVSEICVKINHRSTFMQAAVERDFMKALMGGCSVPISAKSEIHGSEIKFHGAMHSFDGSRYFNVHTTLPLNHWETAGKECAEKLMHQLGAAELLNEIRNKKWDEETALN